MLLTDKKFKIIYETLKNDKFVLKKKWIVKKKKKKKKNEWRL